MTKPAALAATLTALLAVAALPASVCAQDCFTNLVPNGGFELRQVDPWRVGPAGAVTAYYGLAAVDGLFRSRCVELRAAGTAPFELTQPSSFRLSGGQAYEVAFDVEAGTCCFDLDVGLTAAGTRSAVTAVRVAIERSRVSARFVAPATDDYTFDVRFTPTAAHGGYLRVDGVTVRPSPLQFQFDGPRIAGGTARFRIDGPAGSSFVVLVGITGLFDRPWPALPCDGGLWLMLPVELLVFANLDAGGSFAASIPVPPEVRGAITLWQPLTLGAACAFGCPQAYSFF